MKPVFREGDRVMYDNGFDPPEWGTVTSAGPTVTFVRYDKSPHAAYGTGTDPADLTLYRSTPDYSCPVCRTASDLVIGPTQALCTNGADCRVIFFDPSKPDGGLSRAHTIDIPTPPE